MQTPASHVSLCVQALPSSQPLPFVLLGFEQVPVDGSQVPASWHWSLAVQTTGLAPVQTPAWQVSLCVHALPSSQVTSSALFGFEQVPVDWSQTPAVWHWSLALQTTGLLPTHTPRLQVSVCVHALPSSHDAVLFVWAQPVDGLHVSVVHGLLSSQFAGCPPPHWFETPSQISSTLQALSSSHDVPCSSNAQLVAQQLCIVPFLSPSSQSSVPLIRLSPQIGAQTDVSPAQCQPSST